VALACPFGTIISLGCLRGSDERVQKNEIFRDMDDRVGRTMTVVIAVVE
jgi:hypothetical protein